MSKVDWSLAKSWADRVVVGPSAEKQYWANKERRIRFSGEFDSKDDNHIREGWTTTEFKPKPWSGPEDGLPPINTVCELKFGHWNDWEECTVLCIGEKMVFIRQTKPDGKVLEGSMNRDGVMFRAIRTSEQLAAEERERAIDSMVEEIVGCFEYPKAAEQYLGLATRLHDKGFKREVV